jgi:hypothetical protein
MLSTSRQFNGAGGCGTDWTNKRIHALDLASTARSPCGGTAATAVEDPGSQTIGVP